MMPFKINQLGGDGWTAPTLVNDEQVLVEVLPREGPIIGAKKVE
jgi:hypothetical protein